MKKVSIIIPAYNEDRTILELINKVKNADTLSLEKEIIVVDNASTDRTREIVSSLPGVKLLDENIRGKGAAVKKGFKEATGDIFLIQDADLECDPGDFKDVLKPIVSGETNVVIGSRIESRFHGTDRMSGFLFFVGNRTITFLINILYNNNAKEYQGCYKALTSRVAKTVECKSNGFDFENELICKLLKRGEKVVDVPIHYYPRSYSEGKKIKWVHGFRILWIIIKTRFSND